MGELRFDDSENEFGPPPVSKQSTDWTGKLIEWGFVSSRDQAQYAMVGVLGAVVLFTLLVYFFWL